MTKKVHKLVEPPVIDFRLIGIASTENDYRLTWLLNQQLGFKFVREQNLEVLPPKSITPIGFSVFSYLDEDELYTYKLIANRCENGFLLPEQKNIDYLILMPAEFKDEQMAEFISDLRKNKEVLTAFEIDISTLKSWKRLLF